MALILKKIASNTITKIPSGEPLTVQSLWENNDVVIYFLRRFGCPVCRWISHNLSQIKPVLDENNVKLVGIGPETNGSKEFVDQKIFAGDIYVDEKKQCYKDLEFKTISLLGAVGSALDKKVRELADKAKKDSLGGNFKGDFNQMGGLLIVKKGGTGILMNYKQQSASDYVENQAILEALGIDATAKSSEGAAPACSRDASSQ
ncbi:unnamed protein product [Clavelina lepadiformis]|uniref:Prostamide/prostaglandin F synthase n=1 Tax=Clavelina lepadiformis TaxID=159417 RepID=A0ABP0GIM8_CLALP